MMLKRNDPSPQSIYAKVINASTGEPITLGVDAWHIEGANSTEGDNSANHIDSGLWRYTPSQAETNFTSYAIEFFHVDAVGDGPVVVIFTDTKIVSELKDFDSSGDTVDLGAILGTALTETSGQIAAAFKKLFDVASPLLVASDVMVGTDGASTHNAAAVWSAYSNEVLYADVRQIMGTAQRATDLAEIAQYLIANSAEPITDYVADDSLLAKMLTADGDISAYDDQVHSQEAIAVTLAANSGVLYSPDASSVITTGTADAGTFASTAVDDATWWTIGDSNGTNTIEVVCEFNMGTGRQAAELDVVGYFNRSGGGGYVVQVDAWNYTTGAFVTISGGTSNTELRDRASDKDYVFALASDFTDSVTTPGEVKIRFRSTRGTTQSGDVLYLNYVAIHGLASAALSPEAIASAVWIHDDGEAIARHTIKFTGKMWYVDAAASDDEGSGQQPDDAYQKIGTAISGASAGDRIITKAGTYTETSINMNLSGLELWGEIGAIIDPASGSALTVSAANCLVKGIEVRPAAGEIGFDLASGSDRTHVIDCAQTTTGGTGLKIDSAVKHVVVANLHCSDYTSVGVEVNGAECCINHVVCHGIGGTETGFKLNHTNAHHNSLFTCSSIDNATSGYTVVSGADDNMFQSCSASAGCGGTLGRSDSGANNSWRGYMSADTDPADLTHIHGTALTETSNQLAGRFVNFFDQASATHSVATALADFKATGFSTHNAAAVKTAIEADGSKLDEVWDTTEDDGGTHRFTSAALAEAPSGSGLNATETRAALGMDAANLDDQLDAIGVLSGEGAFTGTLTVDDGAGNGLEGAVVHARRGGVLKASGTTNSSGEITNWVFGTNTYDLAVRLAGYQPDTDTITVSADDWSKTIHMTVISISAPSAASLCTISFQVKLSDTAVSGAVCKAKLLGINQASDGTILSNAESSDTTDSNGEAELELVRNDSIVKGNGLYRITVTNDGKPMASVETSIPNQATVYFEDML